MTLTTSGLALGLFLAAALPTLVAAAPPVAVTDDDRADGIASAPALIKRGGLDCHVTEARRVADTAPPAVVGAPFSSRAYELACAGAEGLIVLQSGSAKPRAFTCLEAANPVPGVPTTLPRCILAGNRDPKSGLRGYFPMNTCTPARARVVARGQVSENSRGPDGREVDRVEPSTTYEVLCRENPAGVELVLSDPPRVDGVAIITQCRDVTDPKVQCRFSTREVQDAEYYKSYASVLLVAQYPGVTVTRPPCVVRQASLLGRDDKKGLGYLQADCEDGKSYMILDTGQGLMGLPPKIVDCDKAKAIFGGCRLTANVAPKV